MAVKTTVEKSCGIEDFEFSQQEHKLVLICVAVPEPRWPQQPVHRALGGNNSMDCTPNKHC